MRLRRRRRAVPPAPRPLADTSVLERPAGPAYVIASSEVEGELLEHVLQLTSFYHESWVAPRGRSFSASPLVDGGLQLVVLDWYGAKERRDHREARLIADFIERWEAGDGAALD